MVPAALGHYRVVSSIGAGGMGEVFLAEDAKLGRKVALKVLAHELADDPERRDRFEREARTIAALNHPNIITIYSVEEQDGVLFLTMELVEGKTLSELIPRRGMSLEQLLHIAIPLTDAVGAAHQRGITHRDLKPANVMISDEGRLKVLDFGLAKLRAESPVDGLAPTITKQPLTGEGRIMGTVAYMSPEQAQGMHVDARSDVFSLGVMLFEMATGEKPFKGDTNMSVLSAIIKDTPTLVTGLRQDLPRDVGRILKRCLAKDPEDRYQSAKDLRNELRSFKDDVETGAPACDQTLTHDSRTAARAGPVSRMRTAMLLALGGVAVLSLAGVWYLRPHTAIAAPAFSKIQPMRRLTSTGTAMLAAISPDGRYVVHVDGSFDKQSLWMRQASTASSVQIVAPTAGLYTGLAFSPDSEAVLYVFRPWDGQAASLFQIPLFGGPPKKLVDAIDTSPAFSPDGKRMAFIRGSENGDQVIVLANADGTGQRSLASRPAADTYSATQVAWSPDGALVAAFAGEMPKQKSRIVLVDVKSGKEQVLGNAQFDSAGQLAWLRDGSALVFDAVEHAGGRWNLSSQIWSIAYPAGTTRRITLDSGSYASVSATAGGRTLVAVRVEVRASLWVAPEGDSARARPITNTSNGREGATGIDWTPDGRIVYSATTQDSWDIWIADGDGTHPRQLTNDPGLENQPQVLPDGTGIIFTSRAPGASDVQVWAIDLDGRNPRQIATGGPIFRGYLQVIADHVYFKAQVETGRLGVFRVPLGGGPRARLFADATQMPKQFDLRSVSPDERWAVGTYIEPPTSGLAVMPIDGPGPVRRFPYAYTPGQGFGAKWAPDGRAIEDLVFRDGATNLWRFPLDGSAPKPVTTFSSEEIMNYRWSRNGKDLAFSRGTQSADVYLIASDDRNGKE